MCRTGQWEHFINGCQDIGCHRFSMISVEHTNGCTNIRRFGSCGSHLFANRLTIRGSMLSFV